MSEIRPPIYQLYANVILRFIRNDRPDHSPRAKRLIERANEGKVILEVHAVTVGEVFYALKTSYQVSRRDAAALLSGVLNTPAFHLPERIRVLDALVRVHSANVDFGDAYLAAAAAETGSAVASFDRDIDRFADIKRYEP
jgi:predicted nucleic acid-binding protein